MLATLLANRRAIDVCVPLLQEQKVGAFKSKVQPLSGDEYGVLSSLVQLLEPAAAVTAQLSGEKYITSSYGVPLINVIVSRTESLLPSLENDEVKAVGQRLLAAINDRFSTGDTQQVLCHLLDPRFKNPKSLSPISSLPSAWSTRRSERRLSASDKQSKLPPLPVPLPPPPPPPRLSAPLLPLTTRRLV